MRGLAEASTCQTDVQYDSTLSELVQELHKSLGQLPPAAHCTAAYAKLYAISSVLSEVSSQVQMEMRITFPTAAEWRIMHTQLPADRNRK